MTIVVVTEGLGFNDWSYANSVTSFLLVFIIMKSNGLQKLFQLKPLLWLGKISFSVYLLHFPIIYSLTSYVYLTANLHRHLNIMVAISVILSVTFLAVSIYTKYVDQKSILIARKIGEKMVVLFSLRK